MSYDEMVEILAVELFMLTSGCYRADWDTNPEHRRVHYREKAKTLIRVLAEKDVWVAPARRGA